MSPMNFLYLLVAALLVGLAGVHAWAFWRRLSHGYVALSYLLPLAAGLLLVRFFLVGRGETVAQFAAGGEHAEDLWGQWVSLWPGLLMLQFASCLANLVWLLGALFSGERRRWALVPGVGLMLSAGALFVVFAFFPTA